MKLVLPTQIPLCGKRPPVLGAMIEAMRSHERPFVLVIGKEDRYELMAAMQAAADSLQLGMAVVLQATDMMQLQVQMLDKTDKFMAIVDAEELSIDAQQYIVERYVPRGRAVRTYPPKGLLLITARDPGDLTKEGIWSKEFTDFKHFSVRWDPMTRRADAYRPMFEHALRIAGKELGVMIEGRVTFEAMSAYVRMQKVLGSNEKKARERGMMTMPHMTVDEVMQAARDCVLFLHRNPKRRIEQVTIEALVFKGVSEAALKATFGQDDRKNKPRTSRAPEAAADLDETGS